MTINLRSTLRLRRVLIWLLPTLLNLFQKDIRGYYFEKAESLLKLSACFSFPFHQIEQIIVPAHEVISLNLDCKVDVRLIFYISLLIIKMFRHVPHILRSLTHPFQKSRNGCIGESFEMLTDIIARKNILHFSDNVTTDKEADVMVFCQTQASCRRAFLSRSSLQIKHAIKHGSRLLRTQSFSFCSRA